MPHQAPLRNVLEATFRANPGYELIVFDQLPEAYQAQFAALRSDPDFYGLLWPRVPELSAKAVDQSTALLFLTLNQPGRIPGYVRSRSGARCNREIATLVLDGVLEIARNPPNDFVSGAAAYALVYEAQASPRPAGRVAQLSADALRYAQALETEGHGELSTRLYTYNTIPASPDWRRRLPTRDAVVDFLGIGAGGRNRPLLDRHWVSHVPQGTEGGWLVWRARHAPPATRAGLARVTHKLYVSPGAERLPEAVDRVLQVFAEQSAAIISFKIGGDLHGLLRPDKIVAYCSSFDELAVVAERVKESLADCPAQGVPFSAEIDPAGLLSWGMDPPEGAQASKGMARQSWRSWVVDQLAVALVAARAQPSSLPPWMFALERMRLEGIDTDTWTPRQGIWQDTGSA